jgi:glycosyltransferase involved in cell wall biosynthesis
MTIPGQVEFFRGLIYPSPNEVARVRTLTPENDPVSGSAISAQLSAIITPPAGELGEDVPRVTALPEGIFSRPPEMGVLILQKYLDDLPESERYDAFAQLVRGHWKWLCKAAPYLKFPKPKPVLEGQQINIGIKIWRMTHGGTERVVQVLANLFEDDPKYHVTIFIGSGQMKRIDYPLREGITLVEVPSKTMVNWQEIIERYPQDLVICPEQSSVKNAQNILLLKFLGARVLAQEHNYSFLSNPFRMSGEKFAHLSRLYSACDAVSCLSRADVYKWQKEGTKNSIYLPNPPTFDPDFITPATLESHNILWVGRWDSHQKRPDMAIEVFAKVLQRVPDARLIMAGSPDQRCYPRCLQRIRELGIGHAVDIIGFQRDVRQWYPKGALLLSTSRYEGFPMVATEAKAHGLPIVSTAMPWVEILQNGCIQTPKNDMDALADAVVDLLQNLEKRKQLGAEARRDMLENFSSETTFARYKALIEAILEGPAAVAKLCSGQPSLDAEIAEQMLAAEEKSWR